MKGSWLIVIRNSLYGNSSVPAGLDMALAAAAFDQSVTVLFESAGLTALAAGDSGPIERKNTGRMVGALALYGVERILALAESPEAEKLCKTPGVTLVDRALRDALFQTHDMITVF